MLTALAFRELPDEQRPMMQFDLQVPAWACGDAKLWAASAAWWLRDILQGGKDCLGARLVQEHYLELESAAVARAPTASAVNMLK